MTKLKEIYGQSLALFTDLYQLTMAYANWKSGTADREAVFHLFFRKNPFKGGFAISCGLHTVIDFINSFRFEESDLKYLSTLKGHDGKRLFEEKFLDYLAKMKISIDLDAMKEGTVAFAHEPILRVKGPIIQCMLFETPLLNIINYQTLIATKAARLREAAGDRSIIEFGLRRAHGIDGALTASWAAHVGGCDATSNVLAGKLFGVPVSGTHAHSWVMSFDDELEAFKAYAKAMPNNCVFLVDTYDTLDGIRHAIEVGKWLKQEGHQLLGIRLDSGDLAYLSIEARRLLDEAGMHDALILASNDLDEHIMDSLNAQHSKIGAWGVGTKLITAFDQPALGGVFKLSAVRDPGEDWSYKVKISEQAVKISNPGIQQVRRYRDDTGFIADMIFDIANRPDKNAVMVDPLDLTRRKKLDDSVTHEDLLVKVFDRGKCVYETPGIADVKSYAKDQLSGFHATYKRLLNPHQYPVGLELKLSELKTGLVIKAREQRNKKQTVGERQ